MNTDTKEAARLSAGRSRSECPLSHHRVLECGDSSPLLRRRLVAVELPCGSGHAGALALARAVNAPSRLHASRSLTATSRLEKAVTSPRTPQSRSLDCGSPSSATVGRSPRLPLTVIPRPFTCCCGDPHKEQRPRAQQGGAQGDARRFRGPVRADIAAAWDERTPQPLFAVSTRARPRLSRPRRGAAVVCSVVPVVPLRFTTG